MRVIDIDIDQLVPCQKAFNCAIIQAEGATKLFFRYERPHGDYNTQIAVVNLDNEFRPIKRTAQAVRLAAMDGRVTTFDDPRAFIYRNRLYIIYVNGMVVRYGGQWGWCSGLVMAEIRNGRRVAHYVPSYGKNINGATTRSNGFIACEKNWSPFVVGDRLLLTYTINPLVVIEWDLNENKIKEVSRSHFDQSFWKHGHFLAGGTPLVYRNGEYVGFFHSFTNDNSGTPSCRTYNFGFYAIKEIDGVWKVTRMSKEPLMIAEKNEEKDLRSKNSPWLPSVIFPCGFITRGNKVYVSCGWQDCLCQILEFTWDEIMEGTIEI